MRVDVLMDDDIFFFLRSCQYTYSTVVYVLKIMIGNWHPTVCNYSTVSEKNLVAHPQKKNLCFDAKSHSCTLRIIFPFVSHQCCKFSLDGSSNKTTKKTKYNDIQPNTHTRKILTTNCILQQISIR